MKVFFSVILFFLACGLFAVAPLTSGYALAPSASATNEERTQAYVDARNQVISVSLKYLNTPYRYGGMTAQGLDCSGFILLSFKEALGVNLPRSASALYSWTERINLSEAQPGDLLFFKTGGSDKITHVGLYLGDRRFIHAASAGPQTGVIINTMDEGSWSRTFAGAGRVLPEAPHGSFPNNSVGNNTVAGKITPEQDSGFYEAAPSSGRKKEAAENSSGIRVLVGAAAAPTWNVYLEDNKAVRGFASHLRFGIGASVFKRQMIFGFEVRPEYDGAIGVFRLPFTFSWGPNDKVRIFGGPVISFGDATISINDEERYYSGGTTWFGTVGLTAAPFILKTKAGEFAPYAEAAWQSYHSENEKRNFFADFSAGFRLSTGLRWTYQVNK